MSSFKFTFIMIISLLMTGCASPITFYSITPDVTKPGKVHFISQAGAYSSISLYKESSNCTGIQRVSWFQPKVDQVVYVPYQKHLTFSTYIQLPDYSGFKYSNSMFSVPFESGELKVTTTYDSEQMYTRIYKLDGSNNWVPITNFVKRTPSQPFWESGPWCEDKLSVN